ncbi:MAG: MmgE/PrpD family protein [Rubrivivax sp.]|nr:MmgE/PrpD family protein [Rubrivivax sp.]
MSRTAASAAGSSSATIVQRTPEAQLAAWIAGFDAGALPERASYVARRVLLAVCGTGVAAAREDGIDALRRWHLGRGGAGQAHTLVFGDALPATAAAQINGTMCRALDFCDAMAPGPHFGSAVFPVALATAELAAMETGGRGPNGAEFLAAVALGCEVGARFNLEESQYDGFDPTGVAAVFAAVATAARLLRLSARQVHHALGLAFNRCGGSFQSNVDGSLGVRLVQGWVAAAGVECAELARAGLTGPVHFLGGVYGYAHLFGRGRLDPTSVVADLGEHWRLERMMFKPYPSCGATQGLTALVLQAARELGVGAAEVERVTVRLNPYCHRLVGQPFGRGANPRVDAQFSAQYCAANALVRGSSQLAHFTPEAVADAAVQAMVGRVQVIGDAALDARGHTAVDVALVARDGRRRELSLDIAPGFPGNPLGEAEHQRRFDDCMAYAPWPLAPAAARALREGIDALGGLDDALALWRPLFGCAPPSR